MPAKAKKSKKRGQKNRGQKQPNRAARPQPISRPPRTKAEPIIERVEAQTPAATESAAVSFGLLQHEIDSLLEQYQERNSGVRRELHRELAKLLPADEAVVGIKKPNSHNLLIQTIRERHTVSPYVLDLQKMLRDKQDKEFKKQFLRQRLEQPAPAKTVRLPIIKKTVPAKSMASAQIKIKPVKVKIPRPVKPEKNQFTLSAAEIKDQFTTKQFWPANLGWLKPALSFAVIGLMVVLPIKGLNYVRAVMDSKEQIINASEQAYQDLKIAGRALAGPAPEQAQAKFESAKQGFGQAQAELDQVRQTLTGLVNIIPKGEHYLSNAKRLTQAGAQIADLGEEINRVLVDLNSASRDSSLTQKLQIFHDELQALQPEIDSLNELLSPVDPEILPENYRAQFVMAQTGINQVQANSREMMVLTELLSNLLGHEYQRRYLIIFQNDTELRATGGFMGSLALVDIYNGQIQTIEIPGGGTYDFQGSQKKLAAAPYPLQLINARWELQDTNWFFDFPTSARQIHSYLQSAGGPSVDGVIAINSGLLEKILSLTAPIQMPEYGKTITAENFLLETQRAVELEYDKTANRPKQFIADMAPRLLFQLFDPQKTDLLKLAGELKHGLEQKDIQIYLTHENLQQQIEKYDWTGKVKNTSKDYLAVVNSNIAGGKTDAHIQQTIHHTTEIQADGTVIDTVEISRRHLGATADVFANVRNVNYMRVYVPRGSILLAAEGFTPPARQYFDAVEDYYSADPLLTQTETNKQIDPDTQTAIYTAFDKTVFGNWTQTDPQTETTVKLRYQLPYKIVQPAMNKWQRWLAKGADKLFFSVFYQKQSGANNTAINSEIILPSNLKAVRTYPAGAVNNDNRVKHNIEFNRDYLTGVIIEPR